METLILAPWARKQHNFVGKIVRRQQVPWHQSDLFFDRPYAPSEADRRP